MAAEYQKEFFDRTYGMREAYARVWKYARPYKWRLFVGIVCGLLTAGTLVPVFQMVQPAVGGIELIGKVVEERPAAPAANAAPAGNDVAVQKIAQALPSWYPKVEKVARRFGMRILDDSGALQGPILLLVVIVVPLVALVRLGLKFLNHYTLSWVGAHAMVDLSAELMHHVQLQSLEFFGRVNVGQLMARIRSDPRQVRSILHSMVADLAEAPFEIAVSVGFVVWYAIRHEMVPTLVILGVAFPLFVIPLKKIAERLRKLAQRSMERGSAAFSRIHEVLTCIRLVKSSNAEDLENAAYARANRNLLKVTLRGVRLGALVPLVMEMTGVLLLCAFVCWCFTQRITLDRVLPMLAPLLVIYKPVRKLAKLQVSVETALASLCRVYSLLDLDMTLPEAARPVPKKTLKERIVFEDASYRYPGADRDAVSRVSFEIPKGAKVAVVGSTGSGKSTLGALLARFADVRSGRILFDGVDVRDISTDDLRALVGVITQDTLLFDESIAYNIRYGSFHATDRQVAEAARIAHADDFIASQSGGYDRLCGEKGFSLSGGERQRLAIARAVLKNPPLLILDEATSALDNITEREVQDALETLMSNRTSFVIAHRLSTVRNADLILVMRDGCIVERGRHDELYALGGVYRNLCDMQAQT